MKNKTTLNFFMLIIISISVLFVSSLFAAKDGIRTSDQIYFGQKSSAMIIGDQVTCEGTIDVSYKTDPDMEDYIWTVSDGGNITYGQGTNAIQVTWRTPGDQNVSVKYRDPIGGLIIYSGDYHVVVNPLPVPSILGDRKVCINSDFVIYETEENMQEYDWTVTNGGTILSGAQSDHILVKWLTPGEQFVSVTYVTPEGCKASEPTTQRTFVESTPDPNFVIVGNTSVCAGTTDVNYSVDPQENIDEYVWTLPQGAAITGGIGTNSIDVQFSNYARSGDVTVLGQNLCGDGAPSLPLPVVVNPLPGDPGIVEGPTQACKGQTEATFSVSPIVAAESYVWTLPAGATITSGANTNTIQVFFAQNSASGVVRVYGANHCGDGASSPNHLVQVNDIPLAPVIALNDNMLRSSASVGNQWYMNGNVIPGATRQQLLVTQNGTYYSVVSVGGCTSDPSNTIDVVLTKVNEISESNFQVYPTPSNGQFNVKLTGSDNSSMSLKVYNELGMVIYSKDNLTFGETTTYTVNLGSVPAGTYAVVLQGDKNHFVKNILIK